MRAFLKGVARKLGASFDAVQQDFKAVEFSLTREALLRSWKDQPRATAVDPVRARDDRGWEALAEQREREWRATRALGRPEAK